MNLFVCLSKQEPHDQSVLFTIVLEGRLYIDIMLNYIPNHSLLWPNLSRACCSFRLDNWITFDFVGIIEI